MRRTMPKWSSPKRLFRRSMPSGQERIPICSSNPESIGASITIQRVFRGHLSRMSLESKRANLVDKDGSMVALAGTIQGSTGWYQSGPSVFYACYTGFPSNPWVIMVGPLDTRFYRHLKVRCSDSNVMIACPGTVQGQSGFYLDGDMYVTKWNVSPQGEWIPQGISVSDIMGEEAVKRVAQEHQSAPKHTDGSVSDASSSECSGSGSSAGSSEYTSDGSGGDHSLVSSGHESSASRLSGRSLQLVDYAASRRGSVASRHRSSVRGNRTGTSESGEPASRRGSITGRRRRSSVTRHGNRRASQASHGTRRGSHHGKRRGSTSVHGAGGHARRGRRGSTVRSEERHHHRSEERRLKRRGHSKDSAASTTSGSHAAAKGLAGSKSFQELELDKHQNHQNKKPDGSSEVGVRDKGLIGSGSCSLLGDPKMEPKAAQLAPSEGVDTGASDAGVGGGVGGSGGGLGPDDGQWRTLERTPPRQPPHTLPMDLFTPSQQPAQAATLTKFPALSPKSKATRPSSATGHKPANGAVSPTPMSPKTISVRASGGAASSPRRRFIRGEPTAPPPKNDQGPNSRPGSPCRIPVTPSVMVSTPTPTVAVSPAGAPATRAAEVPMTPPRRIPRHPLQQTVSDAPSGGGGGGGTATPSPPPPKSTSSPRRRPATSSNLRRAVMPTNSPPPSSHGRPATRGIMDSGGGGGGGGGMASLFFTPPPPDSSSAQDSPNVQEQRHLQPSTGQPVNHQPLVAAFNFSGRPASSESRVSSDYPSSPQVSAPMDRCIVATRVPSPTHPSRESLRRGEGEGGGGGESSNNELSTAEERGGGGGAGCSRHAHVR